MFFYSNDDSVISRGKEIIGKFTIRIQDSVAWLKHARKRKVSIRKEDKEEESVYTEADMDKKDTIDDVSTKKQDCSVETDTSVKSAQEPIETKTKVGWFKRFGIGKKKD
jgi:hypothetical protein